MESQDDLLLMVMLWSQYILYISWKKKVQNSKPLSVSPVYENCHVLHEQLIDRLLFFNWIHYHKTPTAINLSHFSPINITLFPLVFQVILCCKFLPAKVLYPCLSFTIHITEIINICWLWTWPRVVSPSQQSSVMEVHMNIILTGNINHSYRSEYR
jgi:hypothetical protein